MVAEAFVRSTQNTKKDDMRWMMIYGGYLAVSNNNNQ